ncbi:MAG: replication-relaxation family protein [Actinomycetota bacterium]|nr:replication-relaxation family protein [Actinomycetota bacterium]
MTIASSPRRGGVSALDVFGRLTRRDRFLCRVLWEHRVLTTEQVRDLCFTSLVSTQHRLVALYRLGVLDRFRPLRPTGSESWRYTLGPLGAALVAAERGVDVPRSSVLRDRVVALAAGQWTTHTLGVDGFFCSLHRAARERSDAALVAWWSEPRCAAEWGELVRPDAYWIWEDDGQRAEFFVEHDTGSEPLGRVASELGGYRDLAEADGVARPVLFWLAQAGREPGLRKALGTTTLPVETAVAGSGNPADAIWLPVEAEIPRRRLAQLARATAGSTR